MKTIHDVREQFDLNKFLDARLLTMEAVTKVKDAVEIGMTESDGLNLIDKVLDDMGAEKKWHPNKFRIGKNTIKSFREESNKSDRLKADDLFFIDIGPVWDNHEGDYGETFTMGDRQEFRKIISTCQDIFNQTAEVWRTEKKSGIELYKFASSYAKALGYRFNDRMRGHRIGDFPHHLFYKGGLNEIEDSPCDNLWILEIHIIDKNGKYGAFFEDILKEEPC